ncbi:hypothetical protein [Photobacterium atrarenae]|uniref:Uncharacterized protein n=1 Tax=Photobacterium atrarenae TaxID=865757 RepID=A0ABY5GMQ1_9GAMM|nr:hypothetical protein [Photobacterium atrarenae]UTV30589.1 hypothetical protein NNL38_18670 [Photobacterium atrarenae]
MKDVRVVSRSRSHFISRFSEFLSLITKSVEKEMETVCFMSGEKYAVKSEYLMFYIFIRQLCSFLTVVDASGCICDGSVFGDRVVIDCI